MLILGIETSCDETAAAVVENGTNILSNVISSQVIHKKYGGVVPELASRAHLKLILPIIEKALHQADIPHSDVEAIAVTNAPGLIGALLIGVSVAKSLAYSWQKPLVGVNHLEGHLFANFLQYGELEMPFICVIISGGHTRIVCVEDKGKYKIVGRTRDDAAGEAYDKVAKMMNLGYPGGPIIDKMAAEGDPTFVDFPRPKIKDVPFDFSFSGLKTAVLNYLSDSEIEFIREHKNDIVASFQQAVIDVIAERAISACKVNGIKNLAFAGGVASNSALRKRVLSDGKKENINVYFPSPVLCTDNAAMIASAGFFRYIQGDISSLSLNASPKANLGD